MDQDDILAPPNGGYGWVVTLLAAINIFFSSGIISSIGNLLDTFVEVCTMCDLFVLNFYFIVLLSAF